MMHEFLSRRLNRSGSAVRRRSTEFLVLSVLFTAAGSPCSSYGQPVEAGANDQSGFSVRKAKQDVSDAIEDFERYRDKAQWGKAFTAIGKVFDAQPDGLLREDDGLLIPTKLKIRAELMSLPPAGREAYRLFNDPTAQQLFSQATDSAADATGRGPMPRLAADDIAALRSIVDRYFVTSVGDKAADRLGDALFEAGQFNAADRAWQMILENYPDSGLSAALLQTKRGIALARAGEWEQFAAVRALVHERFAGQMVHIGGKDLPADQVLDDLAHGAPATTAPSVTAPPGLLASTMLHEEAGSQPISPPAGNTPVWQVPLLDQATCDRIEQQANQIGWGGMALQYTNVIPPTAVDKQRMYVDWLGSCFALDLVTGKMLWRTNPFVDFGENFQQMLMQGELSGLSLGAIAAIGDRVLVIKAAPPEMPGRMRQSSGTKLILLAADTGKTIWNSEQVSALSNWEFVGRPLVSDDAIYLCGFTQQSPAMNLMCLGLAKGELRWHVELGNATTATDFRGVPQRPTPSLFKQGEKVYVLTNNGALVAVDQSSHEIEWAISYGSGGSNVENGQRFFNPYQAQAPAGPIGAMLSVGSTLYFKETDGETLYAMDLSGPALKWKRPVDASVGLVAGDEHNLYLSGSEIDCIDIDSRAMRWSNRLSSQGTAMAPLLAADQLWAFSDQGIHEVQTKTGEADALFRGYDRESDGGDLSRTADRLITISSRAITAYPLEQGGRP